MRCPKCGYISFDHQDSCRKCHQHIAQTEFQGTTYPGLVPVFLQLSPELPDSGHDEVMVVEEHMVDVLDPDLDLLAENSDTVEGQSAETEIIPGDDFELSFDLDQKEDDLSLDEDDLSIDTSRFADVPINMQAVQEKQAVQFAIPEELADISDLARPDAGIETKSEFDVAFSDGDDDLNLDDLDLSFGGEKESGVASLADDELDLSLDDIDLSGGLEAGPPPALSRPVDDDLNFDLDLGALGEVKGASLKKVDDDLDFDLDLGTLGEEKDRRQKKVSDDLPDLTLSL